MHDDVPGTVLSEGGPWGGSGGNDGEDKKSWGKPRPGNAGPSALDALIRRGRARFGGGGGGGFEGPHLSGLWQWIVAALILLWVAITSTHTIGLQERGVVMRFGKYVGTLDPGVRWTLPLPIDRVVKVNVDEIKEIDIDNGPDGQPGENLVLTGDENLIDLAYSVRWSKRDPEQYLFEMQDPETTIKEVAESAMREAIARVSFDQVIGQQRQIQQEVADRAQELLDSYHSGVVVQGVTIKQAAPPAEVMNAFKDVSAAQQNVQTFMKQAQSYATQVTARAQGEAAQFDAVYTQYKLSPEVTRRRMYYDTMEKVLAKTDKVVVEPRNVVPYLAPPTGAAKTQEPAK
jgi:membrane protease subunit HflK